MPDFALARERMVAEQIAARGIADPQVLRALGEVPRELFVSSELSEQAYDDRPLPIEAGQTISQPYIVAFMIAAAGVRPGHRVLEVGAGSGYAAAVIGQIAQEVVAVERHGELARIAAARMKGLGYWNVRVIEGDGSLGAPCAAPFDAIIASAAGSHVPEALALQLVEGGVLVMPVGRPGGDQHLVRVTRQGPDDFAREQLDQVRFVPLIGAEAWPPERR